jgi:hypothetical protein
MSNCIYISHAHADDAFAIELRDHLRVEGYDLCTKSDSVEKAALLIVITSPSSVASEGVIQELQAFPGHRKAVIPVIPPSAPTATLDWIPHYLALLDLVDFADDEDAAYQKLLKMLGPAPQRTRRKGETDEKSPRLLRRIPIGLPVIVLLVAALVAAFSVPEGSPIPRPVGLVMLLLGVLGGVLLVGGVIRQAQQESQKKKHLRIPEAFVEVIESGRKRESGQRIAITSARISIGKQAGNNIRLTRRGVGAQQCQIVWDQYDEAFYLETSDTRALTTLHDQLLKPEQPLPIGNGDIIMLADQVVLQFRLGKAR